MIERSVRKRERERESLLESIIFSGHRMIPFEINISRMIFRESLHALKYIRAPLALDKWKLPRN